MAALINLIVGDWKSSEPATTWQFYDDGKFNMHIGDSIGSGIYSVSGNILNLKFTNNRASRSFRVDIIETDLLLFEGNIFMESLKKSN